ncbi:MAG TPA: PIG-L deacetylase family protein [Acidimicrobiales bacterium]|nr:PIG-L deacetylase family protein [Acidimicrobiales bacterium]
MDIDGGVERILIVTAHPDDVDFGAGGTVATWTDKGIEVSYCVVTDGDAGGFDPAIPRTDIPSIRRAEQEAAAKTLGVTDVVFLGYPDGRLTVTLELRRDIARVIRRVRPQRVVCQSPERNWDRIYASHPDHMAAGEATACAVYPDARNPFTFRELADEGLEAHVVPELWVMSAKDPDVFVDITDVIERKIEALLCHASQHPDPGGLHERMPAWARATAQAGGLPDGRLAEAFRRVNTA